VNSKRLLPLVGCMSLAALPSSAAAMVPFDVQVPLVLKALTYDRSLKGRVTDQVRIGVLVPPRGRGTADELMAALGAMPDRTLNGLPVTFRELGDDSGLDQALRNGHWAAIYVMPGFKSDEIAQILKVAAARQVLAVAAQVEDVERGIAFGVGAHAGKPELVVNLPSVKACGSEFDLALLRVARVIQ